MAYKARVTRFIKKRIDHKSLRPVNETGLSNYGRKLVENVNRIISNDEVLIESFSHLKQAKVASIPDIKKLNLIRRRMSEPILKIKELIHKGKFQEAEQMIKKYDNLTILFINEEKRIFARLEGKIR